MMAFPIMLLAAAKKAGIKTPKLEKTEDGFYPEEFPHFHCFCVLQLGRPMRWGEHWENAKIIAAIPEVELKKMTLEDFISKGLHYTAN